MVTIVNCLPINPQMLSEADDNRDGLLTEAQWSKVELWFQYKAFLPGSEDDLEAGPEAAAVAATRQKAAYDRAGALKAVLWDMLAQRPSPEAAPQVDFKAALLYLCPDRDMFTGIKKAFSVATASIASNARADASQVLQVAYPLQGAALELAAQIGRMPFNLDGVQKVVSTIYESRKPAAVAGSRAATPQTTTSAPDAVAATPTISAEQLMYSAGGERLVVQLMQRYQWKDLYVATKLL